MSFKVTVIGAGSIGFTKTLISDLLKVPEFTGCEFALTDINPHNLDMVHQVIQTIVSVNNLPAKVTATTDRRAAITGARYIMSCVRVGGLEAGSHVVKVTGVFGKTLYEAEIDLPDGTRTKAEMKNGVPYFRETGVEHNVKNGNDFECAFIEVEFLTVQPKGF